MSETAFGHRAVPHTADVRVEAWGPTRELCIAEAVLGTVETFLDTSSAHPVSTYRCHVSATSDEDLLVAVLDEIIYLLDAAGVVPLDVELEPVNGDLEARFETIDATSLPLVGAVPKGVSLHELHLASGSAGWSCSVTLDV